MERLSAIGFGRARFAPPDDGTRTATEPDPAPAAHSIAADPGADVDILPMSFAQQRLWILEQLEPGSSAYLMPSAIRLTGTLDLAALRSSLQTLFDRHEVLRTALGQEDGEPVQLIHEDVPLPLEIIDLSTLPPSDREAALHANIQDESSRAFDLTRAPLLRVRLLVLAPEDHALLLTMHHVISDGWSMGVLMAELSTAYQAHVAGQDPDLPELDIQYGDYADWQRERLSGDHLQGLIDWWVGQLQGAPALLSLPTDRPRPGIQTFDGDRERLTLPLATKEALEALARARGATLSMVLSALVGLLLSRLSGQEDVVIGLPVAGRDRAELEPLIGFFINTLPVRLRLGDDPTIDDFIAQVRGLSLEAYGRQELPFEKLVEAMRLERDMGYSPVFQSTLTVQNLPPSDLTLPGLTLSPLDDGIVAAKVDIAFTVQPSGDGPGSGLEVMIDYNRDLFDRGTIQRWAAHLAALTEAMLKHDAASTTGQVRVSHLSLLSPAEQAALLSIDGPVRPIPVEPLHHCVLAAASDPLDPDKPALMASDGAAAVSWGSIDARVSDRARALLAAGVRAGDRIAVCVERTPDLPLTLLALWAAGAAYVPMDPLFPPDRLGLMLEDSGAKAVVLSRSLQTAVPQTDLPCWVLEDLAPIAATDPDAPDLPADPDGPDGDRDAYVIYTSGSTGRPKGVVLGRRSVKNFIASMAEAPGLTAADRLLAVTTISFDIAVLELFLPLWVGGTVVIAGAEETRDGAALATVITAQGITAMQATPATWRMLMAQTDAPFAELRAFCGGEALPSDLAAQLTARCGGGAWNLYGPTETTVWSCVYNVPRHLGRGAAGEAADKAQPIGAPIANTQLRILDGHGRPVPIGIAGQLWIGGDGLAKGYHDRPDLTAERFPADPHDPAARLYWTGDLALRRADGVIEFLGRADQQVKLRGFRIELGEIEVVLRGCDGVADAAVCLRGEGNDMRLEALLVAASGAELPSDDNLRAALGVSLPAYMTPARFHAVDALPLTPNGKVDRKALPQLAADVGGAALRNVAAMVPPRDPLEKRLCKIWAKHLDVERIGIHDNFFTMGGHSLSAIGVINDAKAVFGVDLPMAALFQAPTIAVFADIVRGVEEVLPGGRMLRLADGPEGAVPLFLIPGAGGNPFYLSRLATEFAGERRIYGFESPGVDGSTAPLTSVEALAERFLEEMRRSRPRGPYVIGAHSFGTRVALEMARRLIADGEKMPALVIIDTIAPVIDSHMIIRDKDEAEWLIELAMVASNVLGKPVPLEAEELAQLDEDAQLHLLSKRLRAAGWNPPGEGIERLRGLIAVYRASLAIDYAPPYKVPVDVLLFAAEDSRRGRGLTVLVDEVLREVLARHDWGWDEVIDGRVSVREVPGDHNSVVGDPHVRVLAEGIRAHMADVEG